MPGRLVRATVRAKEARMSSSEWRRMQGWKRVAGGSRDGELIGGEEDGRFGLLPCCRVEMAD
jgi:hypothetical protein